MKAIKTVEHKLRTLTFIYGYNDNPWTDEDEKLFLMMLKIYNPRLMIDDRSLPGVDVN